MVTEEKVEVVEQAAKDELIWARWLASHRAYFCDANRSLLDREMSHRLLVLSPENINRVFVDLQPQLAVVNEADQKARQARIDTAKAAADAEKAARQAEADSVKAAEAAAAQLRADNEAAGILPPELTRAVLRSMDGPEFRKVLKKYGDANVMAVYNQPKES
jgi:hypothetical protein